MFSSPTKNDPVDTLKKSSNEVDSELQTAANQIGRKVRSVYNTASDEISQAKDKVTDEIRSNPVRSSMIALGVGVLLGVLIRR